MRPARTQPATPGTIFVVFRPERPFLSAQAEGLGEGEMDVIATL
jgi:hypothetical protein